MFQTIYKEGDPSLLLDLEESRQYASYLDMAVPHFTPISVLWAIGSRESGWGLLLNPRGPTGTGDWTPRPGKTSVRSGSMPYDGKGFGRGLMQIDYDAHEFARSGAWNVARENIWYAAQVLVANRMFLRTRTNLEGNALLRAVVAAYNCGCGNVVKTIKNGKDPDFYTAHKNYSKDVLDRAGWYELKMGREKSAES